ncbi:MAG: TetR/AcrR family transcriptional regulator [Ardenticatenales bacterium]|nr:TetR/AcrR family transcriptional regulator [Ardenticatenales bacterium]
MLPLLTSVSLDKGNAVESERKRQILDAAERLFSERGYHGASMRDLARELDLKGGSLYSHIDGKEELLWRVLERAADEFLGTLQPIVASPGSADIRLRAAIHAHIRVITRNLDASTVYFHEWKFLAEPRRSAFLERRDHYEQLLRSLVAEAVSSGDFYEVEPKWATLLILSASNWLYQWYRTDGALAPDEIAERFIEMIFQGMQRPEALLIEE